MHREQDAIPDDEYFFVQINGSGLWFLSAGYCGADAIDRLASHHYGGTTPVGTKFRAIPMFPGLSPIGWIAKTEKWFATQARDGLHIHGEKYRVRL